MRDICSARGTTAGLLAACGFLVSTVLTAECGPAKGREAVRLASGRTQVYVADDACVVTRFAAGELGRFLGEALGSAVPVTNVFLDGHAAVVVGDCAASRGAGVDISKLPRDGGILRTAGGRVYLAGFDDPKVDARALAYAFTSGIRPNMYERGSEFAVYEFLERFCGFRFYFPGELGTIVPKRAAIVLPELDLVNRPDCQARNYAAWEMGAWFDEEHARDGRQIMHHRHRLETEFLPCSHGLNEFHYLKRFGKTHPEYFQMLVDGTRNVDPKRGQPGQLCHTSGIWEEIYRDVRSFFLDESPDVRGIPANAGWTSRKTGAFGWNCNTREIKGLGKFADVMPQDGFQECHCPNCQRAYRKEKGTSYASDLIWGKVKDLCERLKAEGIEGTVTMMGYTPYSNPPDFPLPDNLRVMVARGGPWSEANPATAAREKAEIRKWSEKIGKKVWLWNYPCKFRGEFPDIPEHCPRAWGKFYGDLAPWIFGGYAQNTTTRWMYSHLNCYVLGKVFWNMKTDVDALLEEYYTLMYGAGREEMKEFFETLERKWRRVVGTTAETPLGPVVVRPSEYRIFADIYSPEALKRLETCLAQATAKVGASSLEGRRVALMKRELFDPLKARAAAYGSAIDVKAALARRAKSKPANLLANGDFAKDLRGWNGRVEYDAADGVAAPGCVKVVSDGKGNDAYQHFNRDGLSLKPDTKYRLSFFVKLQDVRAEKGGRWCGVFGNAWAGANCWTPQFFGHTGTTGWMYQELVFTTCGDAEKLKQAYVSLKVMSAKGTAWFDDVVLEEMPSLRVRSH